MQKIVQFGKMEYQGSSQVLNSSCINCLRLQAEIVELKDMLEQRDSINQRDSDSQDYDRINIKAELIDIRQKYEVLQRNMQKIEQQNDDLFTQKTRLQKKLSNLNLQFQGYQREKHQIGITPVKEKSDKNKPQDKQTEKKQLQVSLLIERQKVANLEMLTRNKDDEIVKLKQLLRKRTILQSERHKLLEQLQLQGV